MPPLPRLHSASLLALLATGAAAQISLTHVAPIATTINSTILAGQPGGRGQMARVLWAMAPIITPHIQPTTTTRVFTLAYDTHSSVHAHWAAYRLARSSTLYAGLAATSQLALDPVKLSNEVPFLQYPYAAAWFLRLAIDYEQWSMLTGIDPQRLRPVGNLMAAWLETYYTTWTIDPYAVEYQNPAWALYQLHAYATFTGNTALADRTQARIANAFVIPIANRTFGADLNASEFFSVVGNWYYVVAKTQPAATFQQFLAMQAPIPGPQLAVNNLTSGVHSYGMGWSRAWAFRRLAEVLPNAADRLRFAQAAYDHIQVGMTRHTTLTGNFFAYDHWVPQFAVYAVTEAL